MPTTRPRHQITETDEVARALDAAAKRWPQERSRARLLLRLVDEGHRSLRGEQERQRATRTDAVRQTSGSLTGAYSRAYLDELREDWPA